MAGRVICALRRAWPAAAIVAVGLGLAGVATAGNPGNPSSFGATATANILALITIHEDRNLDFGKIIRPTSGNRDFIVGTDGSMTVGPGTGGQAAGGHEAGQYDITGTPGESYVFTSTSDGCTNLSGILQLISVEVDVNTLVLPELDIQVGGKLRVGSAVPFGSYTCSYSLQAHY